MRNMPKNVGEKEKILLIRDYLLRESDQDHPVSVKDIQSVLERSGFYAERKSIYRDLAALGSLTPEESSDQLREKYQLQIINKNGKYYVEKREFTLDEVKLLIDMVESSSFLTAKGTKDMKRKLGTLVSVHQAMEVDRSIHVRNRVKQKDDKVFRKIDIISQAINEHKLLTFRYRSYTIEKKRVYRHGGASYHLTPYALMWVEEKYYLLGYSEENREFRVYRVDRMDRLTKGAVSQSGEREFKKIDIADYTTKVFHMYQGRMERVTMRFELSLTDAVLDRFGTDAMLIPDGEKHFTYTTELSVSVQFFGWISGFGSAAEIVAPENVRQEMAEQLRSTLRLYSE